MAYASTCIFRSHRNLTDSTFLHKILSVHDLENAQNAVDRHQHRRWQNPSHLPINDAISVTSCTSEFHPLTRCHTIECNVSDVLALWNHTLLFTAREILHQPELYGIYSVGAHRSCSIITGALCVRNASSSFTLGIITKCSSGSYPTSLRPQLQIWSDHFIRRNIDEIQMFEELPICRNHRESKMSVWWEPSQVRVVPNTPIPDLRVTSDAHPDVVTKVCLFLVRPLQSRLLGTLLKTLPDPSDAPDGKEKKTVAQDVRRRQVIFDNVCVSQGGEHVLALATVVASDYLPFVAIHSKLVPPFLVVE